MTLFRGRLGNYLMLGGCSKLNVVSSAAGEHILNAKLGQRAAPRRAVCNLISACLVLFYFCTFDA